MRIINNVVFIVLSAVCATSSIASEVPAMEEDVFLYLRSMQGGYWMPKDRNDRDLNMGDDLITCLSKGRLQNIEKDKYVAFVNKCMTRNGWEWKIAYDA